MAEPSTGNDQQQADNNDGEMERQLVSSLAKLQQLETMVCSHLFYYDKLSTNREKQIHHLRTLLPERLLEPLVPIVNPRVTAQGKPMPKSPQMLYEQLSKAARDGVAEVTNFQTMWRGPEMRAVWEQVDAKARENNGVLLQPTGMWERDYDVLLERLVREEEGKREGQRREMEEMERERVNESADGNWRKVVDGFVQRSGGSGVRVVPSKGRDAVTVMLVKAGMTFEAQLHAVVDADGVHEWRVSNKVAPGRPVTKLESAICECLNSRPRQWDLSFLLVGTPCLS